MCVTGEVSRTEGALLEFRFNPAQEPAGVQIDFSINDEVVDRMVSRTKSKSGGCLCGAVRYEACPIENSAYYCHCRDCQIGSASAFTVAVFTKESDFRVLSGELTSYEKTVDSGRKLRRLFCASCGTPLCWTGEGFPDVVLVSLSSLDDPEAYQPVHEGWTNSAVSWNRIRDDIQSFRKKPVREESSH